MPEILVAEIVCVDLDRLPVRLILAPDSLEIPDKLTLLGIHRDRGFARRKRRPRGLVDVAKLRVAVRMILPLPGLLIGCNRNPSPRSSFPADPSEI